MTPCLINPEYKSLNCVRRSEDIGNLTSISCLLHLRMDIDVRHTILPTSASKSELKWSRCLSRKRDGHNRKLQGTIASIPQSQFYDPYSCAIPHSCDILYLAMRLHSGNYRIINFEQNIGQCFVSSSILKYIGQCLLNVNKIVDISPFAVKVMHNHVY